MTESFESENNLTRKRTIKNEGVNNEKLNLTISKDTIKERFSSTSSPYESILEDNDEIQDCLEDVDVSDEGEGDDLMVNVEKDYVYKSDLDHYNLEDGNIDDQNYEELDLAKRRLIDQELDKRDKTMLKDKFKSENFLFLSDSTVKEDEVDSFGYTIQKTKINNYNDSKIGGSMEDIEEDPFYEELSLESLADIKTSSILEWVIQPSVSRSIAREFKSFLLEYTDEKVRSVYGIIIKTLGEINSESLEVSYIHLAESKAILALFLAISPIEILKIFDIVAMEVTELHYPNYLQIHNEIHVRIINFPNEIALRNLREVHLNQLIKVSGVITKRTGVFPQLKYVKFDCYKCGIILGPFIQDSNTEIKLSFCSNCQSKGPFKINTEKTVYRNYQKITLQESPGSVPAGRLPRYRDVILLSDLVDIVKPGDEIDVTGIYKHCYDSHLNVKHGFPIFSTIIEANHITREKNSTFNQDNIWTDEEEKEFKQLSKKKNIINTIISSIAPSIYGHYDIKTAIACSLFSGVSKNINGKHSIRGDINVLLLGDPGSAKSQFLKYVEKVASRAVFSTGQGASAVGLTASVKKDPVTKEWVLEGGALVLADKGTCLIDEFDKMNDKDRTSIHEAMEQQSISISKAGIITTLQARCGVIAAANPIGGKYNSSYTLSQNVNLTEPILSRFDVLCIIRDIVNPEFDEKLARFVVDSHIRSSQLKSNSKKSSSFNNNETDPIDEDSSSNKNKVEKEISPIPQNVLMKYIVYARQKIRPKLHQMDVDKVTKVYADLRKESLITGSFPITVRHLESILRISESFAKMRLSDFVSLNDLNRAIKVTIESFISTQRISTRKQLQKSLQKYTLFAN